VWVADGNAGAVSRINPSTRAVVETIPVGSSPSGIAVGSGAIWVTNNDNGTVSRVDPAVDRVVQTIAVGNAPTGVAVGDGSVWVANSSDGTLTRIDAVTGAVVATVAVGAGATDVAVGAGAVWVSDERGDRVFRVDPQSDQVTTLINVGTGPTSIATGFGSVWVANSLDGTVSRIDPQTNTVSATVAVGDGAGGITLGAGGVWVASQYAGTVAVINPANDAVRRTITVSNRPQGLAFAGGLVWVATRADANSHRGGTLRLVSSVFADTLDPVVGTLAVGPLEITNDGLTAYARVGGSGSEQLVPDLAVSLPSPTAGGTTYTFQLRRGIRYSNGGPVRPEDFRRALARDLILGPNPLWGAPFADVVGGAACAAHPSHCDLSRGVVTDDAANTVTFHLVAPDPEFLARLTLTDAVAVPAGTPVHDIGVHPLPATGPYKWARITEHEATLVRNPYFHEWSHAARPDGYPNQIVYRLAANPEAEITAIERGTADYSFDGVPPDRIDELQARFASQLYVTPADGTNELVLNTRVAPFTDVRVRRALNYAIDRAKIARLLGQYNQPSCQALPPYLPGYRPYCPYTLNPNPGGAWHAPNLAEADRLIAASHTTGTPITIWNLGGWSNGYSTLEAYLVSLLDQLGYPTTVKNVSTDANAPLRFADSRTRAQGRSPSPTRGTCPPRKSSKPTSPARPFSPTRAATRTPRNSAITTSTRKSPPRSPPSAITRPTQQPSGRKPTAPSPTRRRSSRSRSRATSSSSPRASATTNTASSKVHCPTSSGCANGTRLPIYSPTEPPVPPLTPAAGPDLPQPRRPPASTTDGHLHRADGYAGNARNARTPRTTPFTIRAIPHATTPIAGDRGDPPGSPRPDSP
jgi:YVTN family beta-propeller protein